jgi:hypothetical protein
MKKLLYLLLLPFIMFSSCKKDNIATAMVIYQDSLVTDNHTWLEDSTNYHIRKFDQGHYFIRVDSPGIITYSLAPYANIGFPYSVQVDGTPVLDDAGQLGSVAVIFNVVNNSNFDVAEVWTNGTFRIWTMANSGASTLVNFTFSPAINTGSGNKNTIKLVQSQSTVELLVNNTAMGTFNLVLPSGLVEAGPAVATAGTGFTPVTGLFNNFSILKN